MTASRTYLLSLLRYSHTVSCPKCPSEVYHWPGQAQESSYYCRQCGAKMRVKETEVRDRDEAALALKGHEFVEACAECGAKHNHLIVEHDEGFFLVCGSCKEELREVERKELSL